MNFQEIFPLPNSTNRQYGYNSWRALTIISLGIGQGEILVTPLQLANFTAVLANKGYYYVPHIVKGIGKSKSIDKKYTTKQIVKVDSNYFNIVLEGIRAGYRCRNRNRRQIEKIKMGGKTGTAQNPHGEPHSIFILLAPLDNPKIAISVIVENGGWGADWAVPIASLMVEKYLNGEVKRKDLELRMTEGRVYYPMREPKNIFSNIDWITVGIYLALVAIGWINIYASAYSEEHKNMFDFSQVWGKQMIWIACAIVISLMILMTDIKFFPAFSNFTYVVMMILLVTVLLL